MKKIIIIAGTRPEAIKLIPVYLALKASSQFETRLISTGQHKEMLAQIFDFFQLKPDRELSLMRANQSLAQITALLFQHLDEVIQEEAPDLVMVQGDTTSAMVASMAAFYRKIKVAHVEAGLRSFDKWAPFPEEVNRKVISQVCDIHFAPTEQSAENLRREQASGIHVVGNTVVDSLLLGRDKVTSRRSEYEKKFAQIVHTDKKLVLITMHRREIFGDGVRMICLALKELALAYADCQFVYPVHLNPNIRQSVNEILGGVSNITLLDPLQYDDMIYLLTRAYLILTDSGGIQEEAPSFDVPLIVLRDVTERPEGIAAGCAILGGTNPITIRKAFDQIYHNPHIYQRMQEAPNPYGDGHTSQRIAAILTTSFFESK